jgi:hypothetical protein
MLVITIITSTLCQQGHSAKPPFLPTFIKHRPCERMQSGWMYLFNALINNAFRRGIYDRRRKVKYASEMPIFEIAFAQKMTKTKKGPQGLLTQ